MSNEIMSQVIIKRSVNDEDKKSIVKEILNRLPEWFGIPESTAEYIEKCAKLPVWVAIYKEKPVGFLALEQHNAYTAEICVMGILPEYHRMGIGKSLFREGYHWCVEQRIEFIQVKTLDESSGDSSYALTREFYKALGFKPFELMPHLWDEWNPCLIMIMAVNER